MSAKPRNTELMTSGEVARLFNVSSKTVTRWAREGRLPFVRTLGGHRRFYRSTLEQLFEALRTTSQDQN